MENVYKYLQTLRVIFTAGVLVGCFLPNSSFTLSKCSAKKHVELLPWGKSYPFYMKAFANNFLKVETRLIIFEFFTEQFNWGKCFIIGKNHLITTRLLPETNKQFKREKLLQRAAITTSSWKRIISLSPFVILLFPYKHWKIPLPMKWRDFVMGACQD